MNRLARCFSMLVFAFSLASAQVPVIESFHGNGDLAWSCGLSNVVKYRIEWASSVSGPWIFSWSSLMGIAPTGQTYSVHVPMFYRVVAETFNTNAWGQVVLIPGGTNSGVDPDFGSYSYTVDTFYMGACEVSKLLWDEVYDWAITNGYNFKYTGSGKAPSHPVHTVSWYDCLKWCNARSEKEWRIPAYYTNALHTAVYRTGELAIQDAWVLWNAGYRLPKRVEWRYAACGGLVGKRFPWGDTIAHSNANYFSSDSYSYDISPTRGRHPTYDDGVDPTTSPVGAFPPNAFGLYDITGNVAEWVWETHYQDTLRGCMGGGWGSHAPACRMGQLTGDTSLNGTSGTGFRVVLGVGE